MKSKSRQPGRAPSTAASQQPQRQAHRRDDAQNMVGNAASVTVSASEAITQLGRGVVFRGAASYGPGVRA